MSSTSPSPSSLVTWLQSCGLSHLAPVLLSHDIGEDIVDTLTEADLEELGLSMGDRKRLMRAIQARSAVANASPTSPSPQAPGGELRQLTIMFCDLVDATALSERLTPEQWRAVVLSYQQTAVAVIEQHGGSVAQYLGDGLLVYFGYPQAQEDAAERAVRAGLALVSAMGALRRSSQDPSARHLAVRIGVHTGTVVIGEIGAGRRREQLALGDAPNLAARLQGVAEPGTLVVSESTRTLAGGSFTYVDRGRHALKGIREPRQVWQVSGTTQVDSRFLASMRVGLTPLMGRAHELAMLLDRWEAARQGQGQVVLLGGEAGVGKSRLTRELRDRLGNAGLSGVALQCSPHQVHSAFHPFVDYIERVMGWTPAWSSEARLVRLRAVLVDQFGLDPRHVAPLASMLSLTVQGAPALVADSAHAHEQAIIDALLALVNATARHSPLLGVIEDVHWADPSTLAFLLQLVEGMRSWPVLLVITHRPEFHAPLDRHAHVMPYKMPGLREGEVRAMIEQMAAERRLSDPWLRHIIDKTDGIPLFVEELTRTILEAPALPERPQGATGVPATLKDSLMARLDRYPEARELAQMGAAIGRDFSQNLLAAIADMGPDALAQALRPLMASGLVMMQPGHQGTVYTFKHALVQDAAYDSMVQSRRQALHRRILEVLERGAAGPTVPDAHVLALHARASGQHQRAVQHWQQASEHALKRLALHEAQAHLQSALESLDELPGSVGRDQTAMQLNALLGTVFMLGRGWAAPEVAQAYARAHALANSVDKVDESIWPLWGVCVFHMVHGEITRAQAIGRRLMTVARQSNSRMAWLVTNMLHSQLCFYSGKLPEVLSHAEQVADRYSEAQDRPLIALYSVDLQLVASVHGAQARWIMGETEVALALCQECERHAESLGHSYSRAWMLTWGAMIHLHRGDVEALWVRVVEGRRLADIHGFAYVSSMATFTMGWCQVRRGDTADGMAMMTQGLQSFRATGAGIAVPFFLTLLAEAQGQAGQWSSGLATLEEAWSLIEQGGERWHEAEWHRVRARLLAQSLVAKPQDVSDCLQRAASVARSQGAITWLTRAHDDAQVLLGRPLSSA